MAKISDFEPGDIIKFDGNTLYGFEEALVLSEKCEYDTYKRKVLKVGGNNSNVVGKIYPSNPSFYLWTLVKKSENSKKETKMFNNAKEQINMNKEIAIQESEKQLGKIILDQVEELDLFKDLPGFVQDFLKKPFGKWITVNSLIFLSNFYTGPMKEELDYVKRGLLRASYSELGDTYINNFFNKILANIKDNLPKKDS